MFADLGDCGLLKRLTSCCPSGGTVEISAQELLCKTCLRSYECSAENCNLRLHFTVLAFHRSQFAWFGQDFWAISSQTLCDVCNIACV